MKDCNYEIRSIRWLITSWSSQYASEHGPHIRAVFTPSEISHLGTFVHLHPFPTHVFGIRVGNSTLRSFALVIENRNSGDSLNPTLTCLRIVTTAMLALTDKPQIEFPQTLNHPQVASALG